MIPNRGSDSNYREIFMVISTIRLGEKIISRENVSVTVLAVRGEQILIRTEELPKDQVRREEVNQRILEERADASTNPLTKCA